MTRTVLERAESFAVTELERMTVAITRYHTEVVEATRLEDNKELEPDVALKRRMQARKVFEHALQSHLSSTFFVAYSCGEEEHCGKRR